MLFFLRIPYIIIYQIHLLNVIRYRNSFKSQVSFRRKINSNKNKYGFEKNFTY